VTDKESEGALIGILTESDILERVVAVGANSSETRVRDVMSRPLVSTHPELPLEDAVRLMFFHKVKKLPVVKKEEGSEELVGIVTLTDVAGVQPALIATLKEFYKEKGLVPPQGINKAMNYYVC